MSIMASDDATKVITTEGGGDGYLSSNQKLRRLRIDGDMYKIATNQPHFTIAATEQ